MVTSQGQIDYLKRKSYTGSAGRSRRSDKKVTPFYAIKFSKIPITYLQLLRRYKVPGVDENPLRFPNNAGILRECGVQEASVIR